MKIDNNKPVTKMIAISAYTKYKGLHWQLLHATPASLITRIWCNLKIFNKVRARKRKIDNTRISEVNDCCCHLRRVGVSWVTTNPIHSILSDHPTLKRCGAIVANRRLKRKTDTYKTTEYFVTDLSLPQVRGPHGATTSIHERSPDHWFLTEQNERGDVKPLKAKIDI